MADGLVHCVGKGGWYLTVSLEQVSNEGLECLWHYIEACEMKNFTGSSELNIDADITILESVWESYSKICREKGRGWNITLFNLIIKGDCFQKGAVEVNSNFHVKMELYEYINEMKWTAKFVRVSPQSVPIDSIESIY